MIDAVGLPDQPRGAELTRTLLQVSMEPPRFVEPWAQQLDTVQLARDLLQRALGIVRQLIQATLASGHVRTERAHETVRLVDQHSQLRLGYRLIREHVTEPLEEDAVGSLHHRRELAKSSTAVLRGVVVGR